MDRRGLLRVKKWAAEMVAYLHFQRGVVTASTSFELNKTDNEPRKWRRGDFT
jgi:hypothetical protein